jgi:hypothetical protein
MYESTTLIRKKMTPSYAKSSHSVPRVEVAADEDGRAETIIAWLFIAYNLHRSRPDVFNNESFIFYTLIFYPFS